MKNLKTKKNEVKFHRERVLRFFVEQKKFPKREKRKKLVFGVKNLKKG